MSTISGSHRFPRPNVSSACDSKQSSGSRTPAIPLSVDIDSLNDPWSQSTHLFITALAARKPVSPPPTIRMSVNRCSALRESKGKRYRGVNILIFLSAERLVRCWPVAFLMLFSCKYFELNQVELCRIVQEPASPNAREPKSKCSRVSGYGITLQGNQAVATTTRPRS